MCGILGHYDRDVAPRVRVLFLEKTRTRMGWGRRPDQECMALFGNAEGIQNGQEVSERVKNDQ